MGPIKNGKSVFLLLDLYGVSMDLHGVQCGVNTTPLFPVSMQAFSYGMSHAMYTWRTEEWLQPRVFSLLKSNFNSQQESSLQDYYFLQLSVMLQYNT